MLDLTEGALGVFVGLGVVLFEVEGLFTAELALVGCWSGPPLNLFHNLSSSLKIPNIHFLLLVFLLLKDLLHQVVA